MKKIMNYISLIIYYAIGNKIPNKFGGVKFRRILVKNIFKECGKNVNISENVYFGTGKNIVLYNNAGIGSGTKIFGNGNVTIGSHVTMGPEVMIITGDHKIEWCENGEKINSIIISNVKIGSHSYIGARVTILQGVTIGEKSIVGACSLVNKNVDVSSLFAGVPAKKIKDI
ncbi:acyltransferase [Tissierella pigra]|uniref:Acyltransferase n=1 Tax=Tissierella pigra TaxID=2607614 RepID=A0A6N7XZU6_9FIRM|nr:acyltransferase [Tissierella pigra]MSU02124.1 acyltransferase [Tissierella pigra]